MEPRADTALEPIPGSTIVGYGFNILGGEALGALRDRLFVQTFEKGKTYTQPATKITYSVPDNFDQLPAGELRMHCSMGSGKKEFRHKLSTSLGLKFSYGMFAGEAEANFSEAVANESEWSYARLSSYRAEWGVKIAEWEQERLTDGVRLAIEELPEVYNPEDVESRMKFFQFFEIHGTHFIDCVTIGGRLSFYVGISKKSSQSETSIDTKLKAAYNGLFCKTEAEAKRHWEEATAEFMEEVNISVNAIGGDSSLSRLVSVKHGDRCAEPYEQWMKSLDSQPGFMGFQPGQASLKPIWDLVTGKRREALQSAFGDYCDNYIIAKAVEGTGKTHELASIVVGGEALVPAGEPGITGGITVAVIDQSALKIRLCKYYAYTQKPPAPFNWDAVYDDLYPLAQEDGVFVALATYQLPGYCFPTENMVLLLHSLGAADDERSPLHKWRMQFEYSSFPAPVLYALIGRSKAGPGGGVDRYHCYGERELQVQTFLRPEAATADAARLYRLSPAAG